jgi:S-adenosylmethionine:diacylglycerol 3-amino-3-carboxypropyl transferase
MRRERHRRARNTCRCGLIDRFVAVNNVVTAITGYSPANVLRVRIGLINISKK